MIGFFRSGSFSIGTDLPRDRSETGGRLTYATVVSTESLFVVVHLAYADTYSTTPVLGLRRVFLTCRSCFLLRDLRVWDARFGLRA